MLVQDDLYLGPLGIKPIKTTDENPTAQTAAGPLGRIYHQNIVPLTAQANNIATSQYTTGSTALTLTAGTGVTAGAAPDGSGSTVLQFDVPRCVSLASTGNMSANNFTVVGFDKYGQKMTQTLAGPNNNTVNTKKAFASVLSVTPSATDGANNVTVGSSDIFGLDFACADAGYIAPHWANSFSIDAGTLVEADTTNPATASTGDVRGTYAPTSASNGTKRLVIWQHLTAAQCGYSATQANLIGVPQA
jgi:hypothetical protein